VNEVSAPVIMSVLYFDLHVDYRNRRIAVHGGVDVACAPNVATAVARLQRAAAGDITIHLGEVTFIDMSGLGVLVGARSAQTARGDRLVITGASPQVRRIFGLGALAGLLDPDGAMA
jgi:anti-sigma B factor antagonist